MWAPPMRVRLQMGRGTPVQRDRPKNQRLASAAAVLLVPFTVLAAVFAIWRLAADMKLASAFVFESGALSHWAVWSAAAVGLGWTAHRLNRYGGPKILEEPVNEEAAPVRGAQ